MLVDQHFGRGVDVTFFGRRAKANPMLARLARQVEVPIHGVRIARLPNHRFQIEVSDEVVPVRDADGKVDVQAPRRRSRRSSKAGSRQTPSNGSGCIAAGAEAAYLQRPVFTRVHSRLIIRCVAGSRAVITNNRLSCRIVRINRLVIEDFRVDQLLAGEIAVRVRQKV